MPDTQRTLTDLLLNLFQDGQPAGSITPQDMRDLIESFRPPFMGVYWPAAANTPIPAAGTYYKAAGVTSTSSLSNHFSTGGVNNRLQYNGVAAVHAHIVGQCTIAGGSNHDLGVNVWHWDASAGTGSYLPMSEGRNRTSGTNPTHVSTHGDVVLDTGDYLELHLANHSAATAINLSFGYLFAQGMPM